MENRYLKISISGKGEVSAGETLERIFDPYSTTKEVGGGFGLASSCYIVKRHGGCITVETGPGGSSIFNVYLPASSGKAVQEDIATPSFSGEGKRVLVMDDDEMVRDVAIATLEHMGFYVEGVIDGAAALKSYQDGKIAGRPFDAVIMDLTVPGGMGGVEAAQELLRIDPKAKLLASSGYSNDSVLAEYRSYGFCGVIQKPYAFEEMQKIMAEIFRHEAV
jgi:CheY-like chemotaxis protein